jgi:hypothetical protein
MVNLCYCNIYHLLRTVRPTTADSVASANGIRRAETQTNKENTGAVRKRPDVGGRFGGTFAVTL